MLNRKIYIVLKGLIIMATKYDIFEAIYKYQHPIKPIEILKILNKNEREYDNILRLINELVKNNLIIKTSHGFQIKRTEKCFEGLGNQKFSTAAMAQRRRCADRSKWQMVPFSKLSKGDFIATLSPSSKRSCEE